MKIDVTQTLKDYEGKEIVGDDKKTLLTLRRVITVALNSMGGGKPIPAEKKAKAYEVFSKCYKGKEADLTVDDRSFINEQVAEFYSPLVVGRVREILEGK